MSAKTTQEIAKWVCSTDYDTINPDVISYAKLLALSHLGMTLAGSTMPFGRIAINYAKGLGGAPEAGILGAGFRTSVEIASTTNGATSHTTELEDDSFPEGLYSCGAWPIVFALGEKLHLSGKNILEAYIIGYEVAAKLGVACVNAVAKGWLNAAVWHTIGNAAAAAKILKLDVWKTTMALSIAASQACGIARQTGSGAHLIEAGFAGRNGMCAAALANLGFTGNPTILEGPNGFCDLVASQPDFDLPLGDGWRVMEIGMKKYPCCYLMQRNIDAVLDLIAEKNISWDGVETVEHKINQTVALYLKYSQPESAEDARFSLEHSTVAAFFDKDVFLHSFTDEKARDPKFREARKKVKVTVHPEWPKGYFSFESPVTIRMKDGTELKKLAVIARGDPSMKLGIDGVMKKFMDCVDFAGILSRNQAEKAAGIVFSLEKVRDVSEITNIFTFPEKNY
jgi:2-methylcitrate dehydratase PrpD